MFVQQIDQTYFSEHASGSPGTRAKVFVCIQTNDDVVTGGLPLLNAVLEIAGEGGPRIFVTFDAFEIAYMLLPNRGQSFTVTRPIGGDQPNS